MYFLKLTVILCIFNCAYPAAIPIWELLTHQEKIANLAYQFIYLVEIYCENSNVPDCEKVFTLYGISNLIKQDDLSLDHMDPYQRDADKILWKNLMNGPLGDPKIPPKAHNIQEVIGSFYEYENDINDINGVFGTDFNYPSYVDTDYETDPHPFSVSVDAPEHLIRNKFEANERQEMNLPNSILDVGNGKNNHNMLDTVLPIENDPEHLIQNKVEANERQEMNLPNSILDVLSNGENNYNKLDTELPIENEVQSSLTEDNNRPVYEQDLNEFQVNKDQEVKEIILLNQNTSIDEVSPKINAQSNKSKENSNSPIITIIPFGNNVKDLHMKPSVSKHSVSEGENELDKTQATKDLKQKKPILLTLITDKKQ